MGLQSTIVRAVRYLMFDRKASKMSVGELVGELERTGQPLVERMAKAADTGANRKQISHIIGIERWGQRRLRVGLGEAPVNDEMDAYLPSADLTAAELAEEFQTTRRDTVDIARKLDSADAGQSLVRHNQFGEMPVRSWMLYLASHARLEGKRIKER